MGLFDEKFDWYDMLVPGSNIPAFVGSISGTDNSPVSTDFADYVGIGNARRDREFNSQEAQKQRDFEAQMSNTAYQRAVSDLKNAGLNPAMLYASGGQGASTPSGSSASVSTRYGSAQDILGAVGQIMNGVNSARGLDLKSRQNEMTRRTSTQIYDKLGNIVRQVVSTKN